MEITRPERYSIRPWPKGWWGSGFCPANDFRDRVATLVRLIDEDISIHDFRLTVGAGGTTVSFDAAVPFGFRLTDEQAAEKITAAVHALDGNCRVAVHVERPFT